MDDLSDSCYERTQSYKGRSARESVAVVEAHWGQSSEKESQQVNSHMKCSKVRAAIPKSIRARLNALQR